MSEEFVAGKSAESDLKPCPFCGGQASYRPMNDKYYRVYCALCGASQNTHETKDEEVESWNARPIEDALRAEVADLQHRLTLPDPVLEAEIEGLHQDRRDFREVIRGLREELTEARQRAEAAEARVRELESR